MFHLELNDDEPIPGLAEVVARQKARGGHVIQYMRAWSALVVTMTQRRVEYVPFGESRVLPGLKHSLFTLFLGIWSPMALLRAPMLFIVNFRGGMDVTAKYSQSSLDPMRSQPPVPGQGERDLKVSQWIFVALAGTTVIGLLAYFTLTGMIQ